MTGGRQGPAALHAVLASHDPPTRSPTHTRGAGLHGSILRAGALWLVGVCGAELQAAPWGEAFALCVQHVAHADLVVSRPPWAHG